MLFRSQDSEQANQVDLFHDLGCDLPNLPLLKVIESKIESIRPDWLRVFGITLSENQVEMYPLAAFHGLANRKVSEREIAQWRSQLSELLYPTQLGRINIYCRGQSEEKQEKAANREEVSIRQESLNTSALVEEAQVSIPSGVVLLNAFRYQISLQRGVCEFVVFKCFVPPGKEIPLSRWIEVFEDQHDIDVIIQREKNYLGVQPVLESLAGNDGLLTSEHLPRIRSILRSFYGHCPDGVFLSTLSSSFQDMTDVAFVAIDPSGTVDVEDALYAERLPNGDIRHIAAIVDVTSLITPGSPIDQYASKLGASIYGQHKVISTLGNKLSFDLASFRPGQKRMAWITERLISPDGMIKTVAAPYLGCICVNDYIVPEQLANVMSNGHRCRGVIETLSQAGLCLRQARLNKKPMMRIAQQASVELIVGESMIAANRDIAAFLAGQQDCPAIFKVHATPSHNLRERLAQEVNQLGVPASAEHFEDPLHFIGIIKALQAKSFWYESSRAEHHLVVNLLNRIVDHFLMRSSFDLQPARHHALAVPVYCSIKARTAVGIANQMQLRASLDPHYAMISSEEMARRIRLANRQSRAYGWKVASLRTFETLERHLSGTQEFTATIQEVRANSVTLAVPSFKRWGILPLPDGNLSLEVGQSLRVKLDGFNVPKMRFRFSLASPHYS